MLIMRVLRTGKPVSQVDSAPTPITTAGDDDGATTSTDNANEDESSHQSPIQIHMKRIPKPPPLARMPTTLRVESSEDLNGVGGNGVDNSRFNDEDFPPLQLQAPSFGLSELALGVSDDSIEENTPTVPAKRKRNPPKEPVICPTCGQNFTRRAHLMRHVLLHTGEKPFSCPHCDQTFNRKDHLTAHLRSHPGADSSSTTSPSKTDPVVQRKSFGFKIMTCPQCDKKFTQTHLFDAHVATHKPVTAKKDGNGDNVDKTDERIVADKHIESVRSLSKSDVVEEMDDDGGEDSNDDDDDDDDDVQILEDDDLPQTSDQGMNTGEDESEDGVEENGQMASMSDQGPDRKFECVVCARVFKEQRSLRRHYKLHRRNFVCRFCGIKLASAGSLMRHNLLHTGVKPYECELCKRRFSRKDALKAHRVAHEKENYKIKDSLPRPHSCTLCPASYTKFYNLMRHIKQYHPPPGRQVKQEIKQIPSSSKQTHYIDKNNSLKCGLCNKEFANTSAINTHLWYHNQDKRYTCKVCGHGFMYPSDLNRHMNTHRQTAFPARRNISRTQLLAQNRLAQAAKLQRKAQPPPRAPPIHNSYVKDGVRYYPCSICKQVFNHRSNRSRHMKVVHKVNPNEQELPPPVMTIQQQQSAPVQQQSINGGARSGGGGGTIGTPRNNQHQTRRFILASGALARAQVSTRTVPVKALPRTQRTSSSNSDDPQPNYNGIWRCEYCLKVFHKVYNFKIHMRTHNKQFVCSVCGLKTASQGDLTLHIRTHTGEKPFQCTLCEWKFCRRSALTVHYRRHHGPEAKIRRQYNPQRLTPNLKVAVEAGVTTLGSTSTTPEANSDSILKTMLENHPSLSDNEEENTSKPLPNKPAVQPRKKLPPPPPLLRYPFPSSSKALNTQEDIIAYEDEEEEEEDSSEDMVILCTPCGLLISGKDNYVSHMMEQHGAALAVSSASKQSKLQQQGKNQFKVPKNQHPSLQKGIAQKSHQCTLCEESCDSRHKLTVHNLAVHSTNTCGICGKRCSSIGFLSRHYQYVHPEAKNAAEEARLLNTTESGRNESDDMSVGPSGMLIPEVVMKEENSGELDEEDDIDDLSFTPESLLETETVKPIDSFACDLCNKVFRDKKALADHKWHHTREAIYPCTMCPKRFKLPNDLIRHCRQHMLDRPHVCPEDNCDSRFDKKLDLDRHLSKVHYNKPQNLPCACQICPARFAQYSTLIRHMKGLHSGADVSRLLELDAKQKKNQEAHKVQRLLDKLPSGDEDSDKEDLGNDYSFELQQLEIDTFNDDEENYAIAHDPEDTAKPSTSTLQNQQLKEDGPPYTCDTCGKMFDDRQKFIYHKYYHTREFNHPCPYCDEKFKIKGHVERHIRTYHTGDKPPRSVLQCPVEGCSRKFLRDYDLSNHLQNVHKKPPGMASFGEDDEMLEGDDGGEGYEGQEEFDEGSVGLDGDDDGDEELQGNASLLQPCMSRLEEYTNENGELFCKPCNKQFKDLKSLQSHVYYHKRESKHPCQYCGAKFKQKSDLRRHIGVHHNPNHKRASILCPQCNRSFTDERYLRIHLNRNCEGKCSNTSDESEIQQQQQQSLSFANPYYEGEDGEAEEEQVEFDGNMEYEEDEQTPETSQDLEGWEEEPNPLMFVASDMQVDMGEDEDEYAEDYQPDVSTQQRFECDLCGVFFSRSNELILHKRQHTELMNNAEASSSKKKSKTFSCNKCGMSFLQKADLTQHLQRYHLNELPVHQCQFCPKFFYVKKSLDTHRRRHHSHLLTLHPCKQCNAKFTQQQFLDSHMKSHHPR